MGEKTAASWRDLTLLQFGALLKNSAADGKRRLHREWFALVDDTSHLEAVHQNENKAANKKWSGFSLNSTLTLLAYFFIFSAAVHKHTMYPERDLSLKDISKEYHVDLLSQNPRNKNYGFDFYFSGMIPHYVSDIIKAENNPNSKSLIYRTDEECAALCWSRLLDYLKEADAPKANTKLIDAFEWLKGKNKKAYRPVFSGAGTHLFDYRFECTMGECYPRFLQQLDQWNPLCMKVWAAFQIKARRQIRELTAVLNTIPEAVPDQSEERHD